MSVIPRHRTKEFHFIKLTPGSISHNPVSHGTGNGIKHDIQAGVSINNNMFWIHLGNFSKKTFCFRNTVDHTVVTAVHSCLTFQLRAICKNLHHSHGKIKLICSGFTTGHIQGKSLCLNVCILLIQFFFQGKKLFSAHFTVFFHVFPPRSALFGLFSITLLNHTIPSILVC